MCIMKVVWTGRGMKMNIKKQEERNKKTQRIRTKTKARKKEGKELGRKRQNQGT